MNRKIVAMLLVVSMVLGVFGLVAAQVGPPAELPSGQLVVDGSGEEGGVSEAVQIILEGKEDLDGLVSGPPAFVKELFAIGAKVMSRSQVQINGHPLDSDLPPIILEGRTLIPARAVSDTLGAVVDWNSDEGTITITRNDIEVVLTVGEKLFTVNGEEKELDVPAQIFSGRTFVTLRFVAVALGEDVKWDEETKTAFITSKKPVVEVEELEEEE